MKAMVFDKFGPPDVIQMKGIEKPIPNDDGVLLKISAASVNAGDWHILRGTPFLVRMIAGLFRPKHKTLGDDFAGWVEAVGKNVKHLKAGDEVFGFCHFGAFAEVIHIGHERNCL